MRTNIAIIFALIGLPAAWYFLCANTAERYNELYGTQLTAVDIMFGLHRNLRHFR